MLSLLLANTGLMPPAAAEGARSTDHLLFFILGVGGVAYVAIMFLMFFFISFNYTILRDTKDTLIVTAAGAEAIATKS